jgi:hypothetical protein
LSHWRKGVRNLPTLKAKTRQVENLPPLSNSERLEMMALLAKSLEEKYEIIEEDTKGDKNGV